MSVVYRAIQIYSTHSIPCLFGEQEGHVLCIAYSRSIYCSSLYFLFIYFHLLQVTFIAFITIVKVEVSP